MDDIANLIDAFLQPVAVNASRDKTIFFLTKNLKILNKIINKDTILIKSHTTV
jgi:hypothetical protein